MGLSFSFLVYSSSGAVDLTRPSPEDAADAVMQRIFPRTPYRRVGTRPLLEVCFPPRESPAVGVFSNGVLIATRDAHLYDPDILNARYLKLTEWPDVRLLTCRSVNDMFAYGHWAAGSIVRCFSVNAVAGVWRDYGTRDAFEGRSPVSTKRWLDLCNGALASVLNLQGDAAPPARDRTPWADVGLHVFDRADRAG